MKRFFRFLMAAAIIFSVASCAKEDVSTSLAGGEVEVTFTADLGQLGTRAYGEAENVNRVYLAVYEKDATTPLTNLTNLQEGYPVNDCKATIQVVLLKDKVYDLVFWAQNQNVNCYTRNWEGRSISVNYDDALSQDDVRDAFFLVDNDFQAGHDETTFKLYRPFAQLNAGLNAEDVTNITNNGVDVAAFKSQVVVKQVATTLNLLEEAADTATDVADFKDVTFKLAAKPTQALTTASGDFNYLSMNYLLVDAKQNVDVVYTFVDGEGTEYVRPYSAVPVQRNYRTNIIGQLISSPLDFNVEILPGFANEEHEVLVKPWDGKTEAVTPVDEVYSVSSANQLAWIAEQVNAGESFAGQTIQLTNDIDLNNIPWTPIGLGELDPQFKGTLDGAKPTRSGECYTIYNLYVAPTKGEYTAAGLFGRLNGLVKNLVIDGAYIEHETLGNSSGSTTNGIAVVAGSTYATSFETSFENVTVKNAVVKGNRYVAGIVGFADSSVKDCTVENSQFVLSCDKLSGSYDNADKGGSIVGYSNTNRPVNVTGCVAKNVTITGYRDLGGIIGYARGTISGNTVEGVKLVVDNTHNYKGYTKASEYDLGSYFGEKDSAAVIENNSGEAEVVLEAIGLTWQEQSAVANATVTLPAQAEPYVLPANIADGVTFVGDGENTVINISKSYGNSVASTSNVTFKNLTIQKDNTLYVGFYGANTESYIDCVINGSLWTYGNAYFEGCTFNQTGNEYALRIYGKKSVEINDCKFNVAGKAILIFSEGAGEYNVAVNDCTFVSSVKKDDKSAIQMHTELGIYGTLKITNSTATGFADINNGLWNEVVNSNSNIYGVAEGALTNNFEKWVDGTQVYNDLVSLSANEWTVYTAAGLAHFANTTMADGAVINLGADIDMAGASFKAIAAGYSKAFTFNGNNHTISNVVLEVCGHNSVGSAALFYCYTGGTITINDLNVYNASIPSSTNAGVILGYTQGNATLNNIVVEKCNVKGAKKIGGLVGFVEASTTNFEANNCQIIDTTVEATEKQAGTILGYIAKPAYLNNCTVVNSTATAPAYCDGGIISTDPAQAILVIDGVANANIAVSTADELRAALISGATVTLSDGTYEGLFDLTNKKNIVLQAAEGAKPVINGMVWVDTCSATFKGLTFTNPNGVQRPNPQNSQYYTTINNQYPLVGAYNNADVTFEGCTFNLVAPTVYGFYGYAHDTPTFEGCTFNCNKIRPIASNGDSITVNGCTFVDQYHYSVRIFENSGETQTVTYTNNTVTGSNDKGEFEGINISKKASSATVLGKFTIKGNTSGLFYRHHKAVTMSDACTYDSDIANFAFISE